MKIVNAAVGDDAGWAEQSKRLCLFLFGLGDLQACASILGAILKKFPNDVDALENLGVILRKTGRFREALVNLEKAHARDPRRPNLLDALAHTYGNLGQLEKAREFGEKSLNLKAETAGRNAPVYPLPSAAPPPFDPARPTRNVIAFSLWGAQPRYLHGALRNARLAPDIYPGWTCRFYCDESVSPAFRQRLRRQGAEVVPMAPPAQFYDGLFWRFHVFGDRGVDRFLIRDCDSVINTRERLAVDEWLRSGRWFHLMRDFWSHTELILAGLWGGAGGILPPVQKLVTKFKPATGPTSTYDQLFLREMIWPTVRQSVLIHDSKFRCLGARDFPAGGELLPGHHVGQDASALWGRPGCVSPTEEELAELTRKS